MQRVLRNNVKSWVPKLKEIREFVRFVQEHIIDNSNSSPAVDLKVLGSKSRYHPPTDLIREEFAAKHADKFTNFQVREICRRAIDNHYLKQEPRPKDRLVSSNCLIITSDGERFISFWGYINDLLKRNSDVNTQLIIFILGVLGAILVQMILKL